MTNERALRRGIAAGACALVIGAVSAGGGGAALATPREDELVQAVAHRAGGRAVASREP